MMNTDERISFLSNHVGTKSVGIEIGVWKGDLSAEILKKLDPISLTLVDPWNFVPDYEFAWYGKGRAKSQFDMDQIAQLVSQKFKREISHGIVKIHRGIASELSKIDADWIYIDGDHTHDGVKRDIEASRKLLKRNGVLIFDDFEISGWWDDGVSKAINEFVSLGILKIVDRYKSQCACIFL